MDQAYDARLLPDGLYLNQAETELKTDEKTIGLPLSCGKRINRKLSLSDYATYQDLDRLRAFRYTLHWSGYEC